MAGLTAFVFWTSCSVLCIIIISIMIIVSLVIIISVSIMITLLLPRLPLPPPPPSEQQPWSSSSPVIALALLPLSAVPPSSFPSSCMFLHLHHDRYYRRWDKAFTNITTTAIIIIAAMIGPPSALPQQSTSLSSPCTDLRQHRDTHHRDCRRVVASPVLQRLTSSSSALMAFTNIAATTVIFVHTMGLYRNHRHQHGHMPTRGPQPNAAVRKDTRPRWPSGLGVRLGSGRSGVRIQLATGFFQVVSYQWLKNWHSSGSPAKRLAL